MPLDRFISLIIGIIYFALACIFMSDDAEGILLSLAYIISALALIWYGDDLGRLTGVRFGTYPDPVVSKKSPGAIVRFLGWCMLILPGLFVMGKLIC